MFECAYAQAPACADRLLIPCVKSQKEGQAHGLSFFYGGDGGIRTLDLTDANRTLSQLSYAPKHCLNDSFCIIAHILIL